MKGQDAIIAVRKTGHRPAIVFLNDFDCSVDRFETGDHFTVSVTSEEQPEWLDLRFLVGLQVSVTASTEKRARRFLKACQDAGAQTVAVCADPEADDPRGLRNYVEVWRRG